MRSNEMKYKELKPYWTNDLYRLERLITEARELEEKVIKGINFVNEVETGLIDPFDVKQLNLIKKQLTVMQAYYDLLIERIHLILEQVNK